MRSLKLVLALAVAAATSAALLAAGVSAAPAGGHPRHAAKTLHNGACRLTMLAAPRFVQTGEAALAHGALVCAGQPVSGQAVTLFEHSAGSPGLTSAGTATTASNGEYAINTPALTTNSLFYATAQGVHSAHRPVKVMPKVLVSGPADGSQLFTGPGPFKSSAGKHLSARNNAIQFTGTVSPTERGALVILQRETAVGVEEWHRIGQGVVDGTGKYSILHKFAVPGDANIRVVVRPSSTNAAGASEALSYEISQSQNPALVIESNADPLTYGQPVTIGGKTASGPGTTLTLLARTRPKTAFAPVATTVSGPGGAYSFTQTPLQSTLYRVTGGGAASALMFEGVKYALSAVTVSASTVQVGQSLTFSGKVAPAVAGHPIYLQVRNPSGIGYHVVQAATAGDVVDAAGNFSITHAFFNGALSPRSFRVKIPGDPQNQGVASQSFVISITPAPGSRIEPEPPTNSSQPHEGQI